MPRAGASHSVRLITGPQGSSRAEAMDLLLHAHDGGAVLVVPSRRYALERTRAYVERLDLPGVLGQPIRSFEDFVSSLVQRTEYEQHRISAIGQRTYLQRAVEQVRGANALEGYEAAAETSGFLHHIQRVIGQLKQSAVDPALFEARIAGKPNARTIDRVVQRIYAAYQASLQEAEAYDLQGLYWMADRCLNESSPPELKPIATVLVDDFDDFTPSEFRVLQSLRGHVDLVFGLRLDSRPGRSDLYTLPLRTQKLIQDAFEITAESLDGKAPDSYTEHVIEHIFWRDEPASAEGLRANVRLMACHDARHELETVCREVKRRIVADSTKPSCIAVVAPDIASVAPRLSSIFAELGVPCSIPVARPVLEYPAGLFVVRMIEALASWKHEAVSSLFSDPRFLSGCTATAEEILAIPSAIRSHGFLNGRKAWLRAAAKGPLAGPVNLLSDVADALPLKAFVGDHVERFLDALSRYAEGDDAAWTAVVESFSAWRDSSDADTPLALRDFLAGALDILHETRVAPESTGEGVRCLDAASVRHLRFDHVYFVGVNEGAVPGRRGRSAIYGPADVLRLRESGIDFEDAGVHGERERLLFVHVFQAAAESLTISWHTLNESGQAMARSPYVSDVEELLPGVDIESPDSPDDVVLPGADRVACARDMENVVQRTAAALDRRLDHAPAIAAGREAEDRRYAAGAFDAYDGVLDSLATEECFGPDRVYSATELETYLSCPFRYLIERVLGIREIEREPVQLDPMERGSRLHAALEAFHGQLTGIPWSEMDENAARVMNEAVDAVFARRERRYGPAIWAAERERMRETLHRYIAIERDRAETPWAPRHLEFSFGREDRRPAHEIETPAGRVRYAGRIDRIDELDGQLMLVDYKSGSVPQAKDIKAGVSIQLMMYAWAAEALLEDRECAGAMYVVPGREDTREALGREKPEAYAERQTAVREHIGAAVSGIRAGQFHLNMADDRCGYCPSNKVCRFERGRVALKTPPGE